MNWTFGLGKIEMFLWVALIADALAVGITTGNLWAYLCAMWVFLHIVDSILIKRLEDHIKRLHAHLERVDRFLKNAQRSDS